MISFFASSSVTMLKTLIKKSHRVKKPSNCALYNYVYFSFDCSLLLLQLPKDSTQKLLETWWPVVVTRWIVSPKCTVMKHTRSECPSQENIPRKPRNVPNSRKLPLLYLVVFVVMIMSHVGVQKPERKHCHSLQKFPPQYRLTWSIYHKFL